MYTNRLTEVQDRVDDSRGDGRKCETVRDCKRCAVGGSSGLSSRQKGEAGVREKQWAVGFIFGLVERLVFVEDAGEVIRVPCCGG